MPAIDKEWLKEQLALTGISQAELARRIGMHTSALSNALNGKRQMKIEEIGLISVALNVPVNDVLGAFGIETTDAPRDVIGIFGALNNSDVIDESSSGDPIIIEGAVTNTMFVRDFDIIQVIGDYLSPRYRDGEYIAFTSPPSDDLDATRGPYAEKEFLASTARTARDYAGHLTGMQGTSSEFEDRARTMYRDYVEVARKKYNPVNWVGREVIAKLRDGRIVLKRIYRGTSDTSFLLISPNPSTPPLEAEVIWAAPIDFHIPH